MKIDEKTDPLWRRRINERDYPEDVCSMRVNKKKDHGVCCNAKKNRGRTAQLRGRDSTVEFAG